MKLVDADKLLKKLLPLFNYRIVERDDVKRIVDSMPTVEQKHGHWEDLNDCDEIYGDLYKCPFCGNVIVSYGIGGKPDNYCGNCGAKMDEVTEL